MNTLTEPIPVNFSKNNSRPPRLPKELEQLSYAKALGFILFSISMLVIPAVLSYETWQSTLSIPAKIPLMFVLLFLSQQGFHLMAWIGHEGFHLNLHQTNISAFTLECFLHP